MLHAPRASCRLHLRCAHHPGAALPCLPCLPAAHRYVMVVALIASAGGLLFGYDIVSQSPRGSGSQTLLQRQLRPMLAPVMAGSPACVPRPCSPVPPCPPMIHPFAAGHHGRRGGVRGVSVQGQKKRRSLLEQPKPVIASLVHAGSTAASPSPPPTDAPAPSLSPSPSPRQPQFFPDVWNAKHGPGATANTDPYCSYNDAKLQACRASFFLLPSSLFLLH